MKSTTFVLPSLMAVAAVAQPHIHRHDHKKREVVWTTEIDYVYETVDITTTVWVSSGFVPPASTPEVASTTSESQNAAQFFQPAAEASSTSVYVAATPSTSSSIYVAPTTFSTSVYVAPTPSSTYVAPAPETVASTPEPTTSEAPAYVAPAAVVVEAPTTTSEAAYVPEPTTAAAYVAPTTEAAAPATSSGECSDGSPCSGDITYYQAGLGACGTTTDGDSENVVALPVGLMGALSNSNPYCGKTITIKCSSTGKTTTATVVDKCMGCTGYSIDLSNKAFLELDELSVGRTTAEWWFN